MMFEPASWAFGRSPAGLVLELGGPKLPATGGKESLGVCIRRDVHDT